MYVVCNDYITLVRTFHGHRCNTYHSSYSLMLRDMFSFNCVFGGNKKYHIFLYFIFRFFMTFPGCLYIYYCFFFVHCFRFLFLVLFLFSIFINVFIYFFKMKYQPIKPLLFLFDGIY